ncbi:MAG: pilus assembly protein PilP, partial [Thermodesulfovibrionales bacterium]|nr:pilus assembly protein PilP [Thermodesulfovibrionales bacterium]
IVISLFLFSGVSQAVDVQDEQQKLKSAIEKAKKPVEAAKEILPSVSAIGKSEQKGAGQQQAGQIAGGVQPTQQTDIGEYIYLGKRDPFMPLIKQETEKKKGGSPLENFMVSDIKVVGILEKNAVYYAQIVLPDGKTFTIKEGQRLGLMGGLVSKITMDGVIIKEKTVDSEGKPTVRNINMKLRKEEEE